MKSDIADVKNTGGRPAGSISAGWFLREFVDGFPWAHLDIAGTAYTDREDAGPGEGADRDRRASVQRVRPRPAGFGGRADAATGPGGPAGLPGAVRVAVARAQIFDDTLATDTLAPTRSTTPPDTSAPGAGGGPGAGAAAARRPAGPRPALTRIVFTRDSIEWGHAATVGDLLTQVPGVYLWRGGFIGRPEPVNFQGRGATSAEYYLDGMPYVAAGVDSIAVDPALFSISFLDRIEVERWPGQIRVYLFTRRHDRLAPRSRIAIARGDNNFARYEARLERRFPSGLGFALAADYLSSPTASGSSSDYSNTQIWAQGSYIPSRQVRRAVPAGPLAPQAPARSSSRSATLERHDRRSGTRPRGPMPRSGWRSDRGRTAPGAGLDLIYARSAWDGAGLDQQINQIGGYALVPGAELLARRLGLSPHALDPARCSRGTRRLEADAARSTASAEGGACSITSAGRNSDYCTLAAGLQPVRGLALTGTARLGDWSPRPRS